MIRSIMAVVEYEFHRSLTAPRLILWCILAFTAPGLIAVARILGGQSLPIVAASIVGYVLIPQVCCMLGLLLWATPSIQSEMEAQTWIFVTMRQHGRSAILLGKYLVALVWTGSACCLASLVYSVIASEQWFQLSITLMGLTILSCIGYGALYLLIGTLFIRRSTIIAFAYTLIIEVLISFIPATINELTISYRLRILMLHWANIDAQEFRYWSNFASAQSDWMLVMTILLMAFAFVGTSLLTIRVREIPMVSD